MKEVKGNIWHFYETGAYIVIPTNGFIKKNGEAVMGRGLALQAKNKFPNLSKELGIILKERGNHVNVFDNYRLFTFPVKHNFYERAELELIRRSCFELITHIEYKIIHGIEPKFPIYLSRVGCGNGKLDWKDVEPILDKSLDDRFVICDLKSEKINGGT